MSTASGLGQRMVGAGWWPPGEDECQAIDAAVTVARTEPDEVAMQIHYIGEGGGGGMLYLTPEMARELSKMLYAAGQPPEEAGSR